MISLDYGRMFETVPPEGVLHAKLKKWDIGSAYAGCKYLHINIFTGRYRWSNHKIKYKTNSKTYCVTRDIYEHLIRQHLCVSLIKYGDKLYRQIDGVGIGTQCSKEDAEIHGHWPTATST